MRHKYAPGPLFLCHRGRMVFGSLFSGIGGIDLGFERAGMTCAWQVEIDDFCRQVLDKHWPKLPKYGDVRDVGKHNLSPVDLIAGGFPCQPHSLAGKRKGAADDRNLWPEYLRIVTELRPAWVVGENVPGLKHTMLDQIISDLESANYEIATFDIPAVAFDAQHLRYRLFIVAHSKGRGGDGTIQPSEREKVSGSMGSSEEVAMGHTISSGLSGQSRRGAEQKFANGCQDVADPIGKQSTGRCNGIERRQRSEKEGARHGGQRRGVEDNRWPTKSRLGGVADGPARWLDEPDIPRVATGIPNRVDRLRGLGNAVVPQVAEFLARQIMTVEQELTYERRAERTTRQRFRH